MGSPASAAAEAADASARFEQGSPRITVLYDAFGKTSKMQKDWGVSAYIEYGGKKILFDTGNNADIFAHNVQAKGIDLTVLDFVVVSHRHGDHTSGLNYVLIIRSIQQSKSMHLRKTSVFLARPCQERSIVASSPCLPR